MARTRSNKGPPKFNAKQLATNRRKAAQALADWNARTGQYSASSNDDQESRSCSLGGTGGDVSIPNPILACTRIENVNTQSGTAQGPAGPAAGKDPLVPCTASTDEDDSTSISHKIPFQRFRGFDRAQIPDSNADCIQDGEAVERNRVYGPDSQYIPSSGLGAHVAGLGTPQMSAELTDSEAASDDDPMETQKRRLEDEGLYPPSGAGFLHRSGRIGFGMLDPNTQCPPLSADEGGTDSPGMDAQFMADSQFGVESTPPTAVSGQGHTQRTMRTANAKTSANTQQGKAISMDKGASQNRCTTPSHGATTTVGATSAAGTMPTTTPHISTSTAGARLTPSDIAAAVNRPTPPFRGPTRRAVGNSAATATESTKVTSRAVDGPSRPPTGSRVTSSRMMGTFSSFVGGGRPPIDRTGTTGIRISPFTTPPAVTTSSTPQSYRSSTTVVHITPTSNYTTQASTLPIHFISPRTTTCTPPGMESIRNLQASTPLTPLNPNTVTGTPLPHTFESHHGAIRTPSIDRNEIPTAPALTTRNAHRKPTPSTPPCSRVSTRVPQTPPSSPVSTRVSPSQPATRVTTPQVDTSQINMGSTSQGDLNNGTGKRMRRSQRHRSPRRTSPRPTSSRRRSARKKSPRRRSPRNVGCPVADQRPEISRNEENLTCDDNAPTTQTTRIRPIDKKRPRKDLNAKELVDLRERDRMRKRLWRAQTRLLSAAPQGGNGGSGSVSMRWRPMIKLFEGIPVGDSQQQLVRALSRFLPNMIPCYRHARSLTDVELARVHDELQSRYENGSSLLPRWTHRACGSLLLSRRMRVRNKVRAHLLTLTTRRHGGIEPPAGVLQCELKFFIQELASEEFQRRSERMTAISRAMVAARGCGNAMGAGGVDRARALYTLREGKPPTIEEVRAWKARCVKSYKAGPSKTAIELRLQDPGPIEMTEDDNTTSNEDESGSSSEDESGFASEDESGSASEDESEGESSDGSGSKHPGDGTPDPDWYHPFLGPGAFYRRYVFLYEREPTQEELQAWLSSGRPPLPH